MVLVLHVDIGLLEKVGQKYRWGSFLQGLEKIHFGRLKISLAVGRFSQNPNTAGN
jgi:hypothetical protein